MKLTKITYSETKNLGDFESCKVEATVELNEDDDKDKAMTHLKRWVREQLDDGYKR